MIRFAIIILLAVCGTSFATEGQISQCSKFNKIALQFALAQNNMQSPRELPELQTMLGKKMPLKSVITTYTWACKNRMLLAVTNNENIIEKGLTGDDDGTTSSKKMMVAYEKLKAAPSKTSSAWAVKGIRGMLDTDPACNSNITSKKLQNYTWICGIGSLKITTDQNDSIISAIISYKTNKNKETIETEINDATHPAWDTISDTPGEYYRSWQRSFSLQEILPTVAR